MGQPYKYAYSVWLINFRVEYIILFSAENVLQKH